MKCKNLIIGAGPAGLAVAARLSKLNIPYEIIDSADRVGSTWHQHYDRLHLHTVKQWSHLPHMEFPEDYPTYVSRQQLTEYFDRYQKEFNITPHFNQTVKEISKGKKKWKVEMESGDSWTAENVVVSTGINRTPKVPSWPGQEQFEGDILHSRFYKNPEPYKGKKVLIIGMGNTGAEVALDLSEHDVETYISVRGPISLVPRDLNGRPVQVTSKALAKIPFGLGDWLGSQIRKVYFGDLTKYGLRSSTVPPAVQLRETGKTPVIDLGTISAIKDGKIKVLPDVRFFGSQSVTFEDGNTVDVDSIILATGYTADVEQLIPAAADSLDKYHLPSDVVGTGKLTGLYFIGYDNYKLGGILGTIGTDSETIASLLLAQ